MGHDQDRAGIISKWPSSHDTDSGVEMVGRLVQQQQVRLVEQQLAQRDAAALAAGEFRHIGIVGRAAQRVHRWSTLLSRSHRPAASIGPAAGHLVGGLLESSSSPLVVAIEDRLLLGDAEHDVLAHRLGGVELAVPVRGSRPGRPRRPSFAAVFLSRPAMIRSRVDLPEPLTPSTPILASDKTTDGRYPAPCGSGSSWSTLHEIDELTGHRDPLKPEDL